jgi:hypothetical protein
MPIAINGSGTLTGLSVGGLEDGIITPAELSTGAPSWDAQSNLTNVASINNGPLAGFRNAIINGNFDIWQRGTSFSSPTGIVYSADRWRTAQAGSTFTTVSRQSFTVGQTDVPNNPAFFWRGIVSSSAGSSNNATLQHLIEGARVFSGQQVTLSFYAKADASKPIAVEFVQVMGTGGTPSAGVDAVGVTKVNLTASWQKFTVTATIPSLTGKTLGTDGNDSLALIFWFDAGSDFDSRTDTLGQQSGTFDIAQVQLEAGPVATPFERRPIGTELALCQRYFEICNTSLFLAIQARSSYTSVGTGFYAYKQTKRAIPTITASFTNSNSPAISATEVDSCRFQAIANSSVTAAVSAGFTINAEL